MLLRSHSTHVNVKRVLNVDRLQISHSSQHKDPNGSDLQLAISSILRITLGTQHKSSLGSCVGQGHINQIERQ